MGKHHDLRDSLIAVNKNDFNALSDACELLAAAGMVLLDIEWVYSDSCDEYFCPDCNGWKDHGGHLDTCHLDSIVRRLRPTLESEQDPTKTV